MTLFLKIGINLLLSLFAFQVLASDYPKTRDERKAEEIGSIAGSEGVVFRPGKIKNDATKSNIANVNKFLWQATIETLNFVPLASVDSAGGVIITDWYSPKNKPEFSYKINVFIKNDTISPDSIEIKVFEQVLRNGRLVHNDKLSDLAITLEDKILRRARALYIDSDRK